MSRVCYYYNDKIEGYYYGVNHPMKPHRVCITNQLIVEYGLYRKMEVYRQKTASFEDMITFHRRDYIYFLQNITLENQKRFQQRMIQYNINHDCPIFHNLFEYCQVYTGGSLAAAAKLNTKKADIVINWSGGLHHAKKIKASGFCYVNDIVIAILELLKFHERVLYVDIDVHHGDGVEEAFYTTDRVMTVSFHNYDGTFFPGTGKVDKIGISSGKFYSVNVPLKKGIDDDSYEYIFKPVMKKVLEHYRPAVIVLQCGADSLSGDRLGTFNLTIKGHGKCVEFLKQQSLPLMLLGGGGYTMKNVARCWTYETSIALGITIPNEIPYNNYYEYFAPDNKLHITPSKVKNENTIASLEKIKAYIFSYLQYVSHAPSVQMNEIPENEMNMEVDNQTDNADPDIRISIMDSDKYRQKDTELSDSEDEGDKRKNIQNFNA